MRKVVRINRWHSVEVKVRMVHPDDGGGKEIRLAADQTQRWDGTYLTPKAARKLAAVLIEAARIVEGSSETLAARRHS